MRRSFFRTLIAGVFCVSGTGCDTPGVDEVAPPTPASVQVPAGFPEMPLSVENPLTEEGISLGKRLFFDPILSSDNRVSCASCHRPEVAFSDPARFSRGVNGALGDRQSMTLANTAYTTDLFWDGRASSLEAQVNDPVTNPREMDETWPAVIAKLSAHPEYPDLFRAAFGRRPIDQVTVSHALAQFERTLVSGNSKFDRVQRGEATFSAQEQLGFDLFSTERADCFHCHGPPLFTDNRFHNNGLDGVPADSGLFNVTGQASDVGLFRSPSLRNIAVTAPYMHDGRFQTLEEVVEHYTSSVSRSPTLDPLMRDGRFITLDESEKAALIAFLHTLTDPEFLSNPDFRSNNQ